jgi:hypothetical protein
MIKDVITFHGFGICTGYLGASIEGLVDVPWVRKFTATPNALFLPLETIDFLQEGWR